MGVGRIKGFESRPSWPLVCRSFWKTDSGKECSEVQQAVRTDKETLPGGQVLSLEWRELTGEDWGWFCKDWAEGGGCSVWILILQDTPCLIGKADI